MWLACPHEHGAAQAGYRIYFKPVRDTVSFIVCCLTDYPELSVLKNVCILLLTRLWTDRTHVMPVCVCELLVKSGGLGLRQAGMWWAAVPWLVVMAAAGESSAGAVT